MQPDAIPEKVFTTPHQLKVLAAEQKATPSSGRLVKWRYLITFFSCVSAEAIP
jgi:hypothetical protein